MALSVTDLQENSERCKDLIIKVLAGHTGLSAKKIYRQIRAISPKTVSYQAVHKSLRLLTQDKVLKRFEGEYYLSQEWVEYLCSLANSLKHKHSLPERKASQQSSVNLSMAVPIETVRFIPFYASTLKLPHKWIQRSPEKKIFRWKEYQYMLYPTGICIQILQEKGKKYNAVDFFLNRRKVHNSIIQGDHRFSNDLLQMSVNPKLSYVMSIHYVQINNLSSEQANALLRLLAQPMLLGLPDNPKYEVTPEHVELARKKVQGISQTESEDVYELHFDSTKRLVASWGNVLFSTKDEEKDIFMDRLIDLECDLQHLWYYFHSLHNELRRSLRNNQSFSLAKKKHQCMRMWHDFKALGATEDNEAIQIKAVLIKTSKIEKVYNNLWNLMLQCER